MVGGFAGGLVPVIVRHTPADGDPSASVACAFCHEQSLCKELIAVACSLNSGQGGRAGIEIHPDTFNYVFAAASAAMCFSNQKPRANL
jgi:hypothetical protein